MDCKEVSSTLYLFLDNEMGDEQQTPFRDHTDNCHGCAQQIDRKRRFLLIFRQRCIRWTASESLRTRILSRLRAEQL